MADETKDPNEEGQSDRTDRLDREELKDELFEGVIYGQEEVVSRLTNAGLADGMAAEDILFDALIPARKRWAAFLRRVRTLCRCCWAPRP